MSTIKKSLVLKELKEKLEKDLTTFEFHRKLAPQDRMDWVLYLRDILVEVKDTYYNLEQMLDERYGEGYADGKDVANKEKVFYE